MKLIWFLNAICIFQHYICREWLEYDPSEKIYLKFCIDSYHKIWKKKLMSFNMCKLKIHIVTYSISSIYSFMNRVFMPSYSTFNGRYIITFIASLLNFYIEIFITLWTKPNIVPGSTMMETFMPFRSFKVLLIFYSTLKSSHFRPNVFLSSELDAILQD